MKKKENPQLPQITDEQIKSLFSQVKGKEAFHSLISQLYKRGIEHMLESELSHFLGYEKHDKQGDNSGNSRNGFTKKRVKSKDGKLEIQVPRDRNSEFEPKIIEKGQSTTKEIEDLIVGLYSRGMSTQDISDQIQEIYGLSVSKSFISSITNSVLEDIREWQNRPLAPIYCVLWMDCIVVKVKQDGKVINKAVFIIIGLKQDGKKEILGLWIYQNESASLWLSILNEIKMRGVQDVLIVCTDNLTGFVKAIKSVYPKAICQLCMVHQIRNSTKFVPWKDRKSFLGDLKEVYQAINLEQAKAAFEEFKNKWKHKYPYAIKSWENNWEELTAYFDFGPEIRKIMYTTNTIEGVNRAIRKYTKNKTIFPSDDAVLKSVFLAIGIIEKKWTNSIRNWNSVFNQIMIKFEHRFTQIK